MESSSGTNIVSEYYRINVIVETKAILPGVFKVARQVGRLEHIALVQSRQSFSEHINRVEHQRRLSLCETRENPYYH